MTGDAGMGDRLLGTLGIADGKGVVRVEDRFPADIETVWSALTDPRVWPAGGARLRETCGWAASITSGCLPAGGKAQGECRPASPRGICCCSTGNRTRLTSSPLRSR